MTPHPTFEALVRRAEELGPAIVGRGAHQLYFVSPVLPMAPLTPREIAAAWERLASAIRAGQAAELLSLYLHIPFCAHRCRYCIYYSEASPDPAAREPYLRRLQAELDFYGDGLDGVGFTNVYLGGGTPSVLTETQLAGLLEHLCTRMARRPGGAWAFECNPQSMTAEKARLFRDHGFNRASFGVQSINHEVLCGVNRGEQTLEQVAETTRILHDCRFWINVDLIAGLPGETPASMSRSLEQVLALGPHSVTIYLLSPHSPLDAPRDQPEPLDMAVARVGEIAARHGQRLEVGPTSINLHAPDADTEQTLLWRHQAEAGGPGYLYNDLTVEPFSLLGLGPTARSYVWGQLQYLGDRYPVDTPFDPDVPAATGRRLAVDEEHRRFVVYSLERRGGLDVVDYERRFGEPPEATFGPALREALAAGALEQQGERLVWITADPVRRFATGLLFVDPEMVARARLPRFAAEVEREQQRQAEQRRRLQRAAQAPSLVLRRGDQQVEVVLTHHRPGRRCFHHRGDFAFYIPTLEAEGTCEVGNDNAGLLASFVRRFDRVVTHTRPMDLEDLRRRLLGVSGRGGAAD